MKAYSIDLRPKVVESMRRGISPSETARRFGVNRWTVKRYLNQLDESGSLAPKTAPGKPPKLDERATRLLEEDIEVRPWATHGQRREFPSKCPETGREHDVAGEHELKAEQVVIMDNLGAH